MVQLVVIVGYFGKLTLILGQPKMRLAFTSELALV